MSRFSTLAEALKAKGARDPDALAAYIGRKKYGRSKFAAMAGASRSETRASCCPDCLDGEAHVFRRDWTLEGIEIVRGIVGEDAGRIVEAYAAVYDSPTEIKDQHGHYMETIDRSAFDEAIRGGVGRVKVFFNHGMNMNGTPSERWSVPIGTPVEIRSDGRGLRTITRFNKGADGDQVLEAIKNQAITGYSFRGPIRQSNPPRIPRTRDGAPLPEVRRMRLGLTEYGPTPYEYYRDANVLAWRSRFQDLDEQAWTRLVALLTASTPQDQEAVRNAITATPTKGPGAEDQHEPVHSGRQLTDIARKIRRARFLQEHTNEHEEA